MKQENWFCNMGYVGCSNLNTICKERCVCHAVITTSNGTQVNDPLPEPKTIFQICNEQKATIKSQQETIGAKDKRISDLINVMDQQAIILNEQRETVEKLGQLLASANDMLGTLEYYGPLYDEIEIALESINK